VRAQKIPERGFCARKQNIVLRPGFEGIAGLRAEYGVSAIPVFIFVKCRRNKNEKEYPGARTESRGYGFRQDSKPD